MARPETSNEAMPVEEAPSAAVQPLSEAERAKQKRDMLLIETEDLRGVRRNDEEARLVSAHDANIQSARDQYPVPDLPFEQLSPAEQGTWNQRRTSIDQANKAYNLAVKRLMVERAAEDAFLAQSRAAAKS